MVRTGHVKEAVAEAVLNQRALEHREPSFVTYFKTWAESADGRSDFIFSLFAPFH